MERSPAKAGTIGKYLGADYKVLASMGHLRDLPKSTLGIDIEKDFEPKYIPVRDHKAVIDELKTLSKNAKMVYLATDPDREGEAISWHLKELLSLPDERARRVTFNEITKKVVQESIKNPRDIDQDLVDAQQARRLLDRLVGYKLSPLLWRKIKRGLSAGRVQSVATRMVVDRENEINEFKPEEYWSLDAELVNGTKTLNCHFHQYKNKKYALDSEAAVDKIINGCNFPACKRLFQKMTRCIYRILHRRNGTEHSVYVYFLNLCIFLLLELRRILAFR